MRNLKKVLSLALCLVMLLGMMVVGASAAETEYKDADTIENKVAVDVLTAIGVVEGTDGNFNPEKVLNRAEGAAFIYRMLTGGTVKNPSAGVTGFVDVDNNADFAWAKGIIADLAQKKIISGEDPTHFNPSGELTGVAFSKMLLVALGYNADTQGYTGGGWEGNVIRDAYGRTIIVDGVVMTNKITRDEAAQMAFQTLTATMVVQKGGIQVGEVVIPGDAAKEMDGSDDKNYDNGAAGDGKMQFCELYFPTLTLNTSADNDDFTRPTQEWKVGKEVVATVSDSANVTLTTKTSETALTKLLPKNVATSSVEVKGFGNSDTAAAGAMTIKGIADLTAPGKKVEIFLNDDGDAVTKIITTTYRVETVVSVTEKSDKTTYKFSLSGSKVNDEDTTNVILAGPVAKDDVVTTVTANSNLYVYPTTSFEGNQSAFNTTKGTIVVGGETYNVGTGLSNVAIGDFKNSDDSATFYVDQHDFVVLSTAPEAAPEYIYVVDVLAEKIMTLDDVNVKVTVRGVLADGTVGTFTLKTAVAKSTDKLSDGTAKDPGDLYCGDIKLAVAGDFDTEDDETITGTVKTSLGGVSGFANYKVFTYSGETDAMTLKVTTPITNVTEADKTVTKAITNYQGQTSVTSSSSTVFMNSSTSFVLYDATKKTARVVTGISALGNFTGSGITGVAVLTTSKDAAGPASLVFGQDVSTFVDNGTYAYVKDEFTTIRVDGKNVKQYTGILPDGSTEKLTGDISADGVYSYDADNKITRAIISGSTLVTTPNANKAMYGVLVEGSDSYSVKGGDAYYPTNEDTAIYIKSGLDNVDGSVGYIVLDSAGKNVAAIFAVADETGKVTGAGITTGTGVQDQVNNQFAAGATEATVGGNATITDNITVPEGGKLTLDTTGAVSGEITVSKGATLEIKQTGSDTSTIVLNEGTVKVGDGDLPTLTSANKGTVEIGADKTAGVFANLDGTKYAEKSTATGSSKTYTGTFHVPGVTFKGEGKLDGWNNSLTEGKNLYELVLDGNAAGDKIMSATYKVGTGAAKTMALGSGGVLDDKTFMPLLPLGVTEIKVVVRPASDTGNTGDDDVTYTFTLAE